MSMAATVAPGAETPAKMKNDNRYTEFKALARKLGEDKAKGEDALPKLAHAVVAAAAEGIINKTTKVKSRFLNDDGTIEMTDQVGEIYEEYIIKMGSKAVHERSPKSIKVQVSKLRAFYNLGALDMVDGVVVMDKAMDFYTKANSPYKNEKSKGAYEYYLTLAKAQCDKDQRNTMMDDEAIEGLMWKPEAGEKSLEAELKRAMKILENLVNGEGKDKIRDTHSNTEAAFQLIRDRVNELAKLAEIEAIREKALALGIIL